MTNAGLSATGAPLRTADATTADELDDATRQAAEEQILGEDKAVAAGVSRPYFRNVRFAGAAMRLYTMRLPSSKSGLVRTMRPLTEANATIARVRWLLLGLTLAGALAAGLLGDWLRMRCCAPCVRSPGRCAR